MQLNCGYDECSRYAFFVCGNNNFLCFWSNLFCLASHSFVSSNLSFDWENISNCLQFCPFHFYVAILLVYYHWPIVLVFLGQYKQNLFNKTDPTCEKCPRRLPSCVGLADGKHAYPTRLWKPDYITCYKNRTMNISKCKDGYFHPKSNNCTTDVSRGVYVRVYYKTSR